MCQVTDVLNYIAIVLETTSPNGIDPATFWLLVSAMGGVISTLAGIVYHGERERRKAAEEKLAKYEEVAPDVAMEVRRLTTIVGRLHPDEVRQVDDEEFPYPYPKRRRRN